MLTLPNWPMELSFVYMSKDSYLMPGNIAVVPFVNQPGMETYVDYCWAILVIIIATFWWLHGYKNKRLFGVSFGFLIAFGVSFPLLIVLKVPDLAQWIKLLIGIGSGVVVGAIFYYISKNAGRIVRILVGFFSGVLFILLLLSLTPLFGLYPPSLIWIPLTCGIGGILLGIVSAFNKRSTIFTTPLLGSSIISAMIDMSWVYGILNGYLEYLYLHKFSIVVGVWQPYVLLGFCIAMVLFGIIFQNKSKNSTW